MRREGWIYAIAFLAIVGVGGMIILPRLERGRADPERGFEGLEDRPEAAPREAGPEVATFEGQPDYPWAEGIRVTGVQAALRGPFRSVVGAVVEATTAPDAKQQTLRVRPTAPIVWFGAIGHQWRSVPAAELVDGAHIELLAAAPPLVVRVREADGRPAVGVPIRVDPAAPGDRSITDAGGTLVLDFLAPGLVLLDANTEHRRGQRLRVRAGVERTVRLDLEPVWRVTGRVLTSSGRPVGGARIVAFGPRGPLGLIAATDNDGAFTWRGPAVARLAIVVRAAEWAEQRYVASPPATGALLTDLGAMRLESAGFTLLGKVNAAWRDANAHVIVEPLVAAPMREIFGAGQVLDEPHRVALAEDGTFRIHDLPTGLPLRVAVRGAGVPVDAVIEGAAGDEVEVVLEPPAGERLAGVLRQPDGSPAAGLRLLLSSIPRDGNEERAGDIVVLTGADGSFSRRGLVGRTFYLRAYAEGRRSLLQRIVLPLAEPLALQLEPLIADAPRRLTGRIYDGIRTEVKTRSGKPLVGEHTTVEYGRPLRGVTVRAAGIVGVTDEEGRFVLEGVESLAPTMSLAYGFEPGVEVAEDARPFLATQRVDVQTGGAPLDLVLRRSARLRFRALDGVSNQPLAFVHVIIQTDEGVTVFDRGMALHDGHVDVAGLPPRGAVLTVLAQDCRFRKAPILLRPDTQLDLGDIRLVHGMRLEGRVFGPEGRPIPGARVGAYGQGWQHAEVDPGRDRELLFRTAVTDTNGRFVVEGFDPRKPADLAIWASGFAPTAVRVELPKFSDVLLAETEVTLVRGAYLALDLHEAGTRRRGLGPRVRGAFVDVEHAHDGTDWLDLLHRGMLGGPVASTAAWRAISRHLLYERRGVEGYIVGPLRPAPYTLWVERPGFEGLRSRLTIIDPEQTVLVDLISGHERKFRGRVTRLEYEIEPLR